ncbi:unnamed protein product [Ixodes hexagonus]
MTAKSFGQESYLHSTTFMALKRVQVISVSGASLCEHFFHTFLFILALSVKIRRHPYSNMVTHW